MALETGSWSVYLFGIIVVRYIAYSPICTVHLVIKGVSPKSSKGAYAKESLLGGSWDLVATCNWA